MRKLLAPTLLLPVLALAQVPPPGVAVPPPPPLPTAPAPGAAGAPTDGTATAPVRRVRRPVPGTPPPGAPVPVAAPPPAAPRPATPAAPPGAKPATPAAETLRPADAKCVPLQGRFMLSFNKADIVDVLEQASRWTCRNFVYTDDVARGKITLLSKTPVTADEAYAAFLAALNSNNIAVYPTGRYYKLIRTADAKKNPIPTFTDAESGTPSNEQPITRVIRLQYADPDQLRGVMGNFLSPQGADIQAIAPDMLIITDIGLNLRRVERLIETIDRPGAGDLVRIIQIRYASAKDIADKINQIFQAQGGTPGKPGGRRTLLSTPRAGPVGAPGAPAIPGAPAPAAPTATAAPVEVNVYKVLPDDRTNKLIVIADEKSFQRIQELIEQLDVPTSAEGGVHVVFLRNANAEELATTLSNLASGQARKAGTTGARPGAPAGPLGMVQPAGPTPAAAQGTDTAELFSGEVKITADKQQNALLVQASGADFAAMQRLIDKLDRPRRQVFVEAVIMEVNLRNELTFGVAAHGVVDFSVNGKTGQLPIVSAPTSFNSVQLASAQGIASALSLGGFLTGLSSPTTVDISGFSIPSLGVLIQALQSDSDVNVLSTPHILATDNEDSEITVGQNVPFQAGYAPSGLQNLLTSGTTTGAATAAGTAAAVGGISSLYAPIQRQNVELRLKIKPQINEGGSVRLTIDEQTEEIVSSDPQLGPTTAKRSVKTQIVAKDQSTIVLGGLIQDRAVRSVRKVPFLGSLPVIGWLFRSTDTIKQKSNLLLFLTPHIIRDEADYRRLYEKKRKEQQEFIEQFYGRQPAYDVDVDFSRKTGPTTKLHSAVMEETSKLENGGPGLPGERVTAPPGGRGAAVPPPPAAYPAPAPATPAPRPAPPPPAQEEGTPVDRLDVQPEVPAPGPTPAPPAGGETTPTPPPGQ
ncbi:MAG TPA: type II secretion system secretin GspD [Anaeromyxobacter sp.]|nr:type II secretion system secretin GspD [Anaeromyxobacter sp.]